MIEMRTIFRLVLEAFQLNFNLQCMIASNLNFGQPTKRIVRVLDKSTERLKRRNRLLGTIIKQEEENEKKDQTHKTL